MAYFKFRRSGFFASRVEWLLSGAYVHCDNQHGVKVTVSLRNPGNSDLHFGDVALGLFAIDSEQWVGLPFEDSQNDDRQISTETIDDIFASDSWGPPLRDAIPLFETDESIHSGETITNQYLLRDPRPTLQRPPLAYKIVVALFTPDGQDQWVSNLVVPARLEGDAASTTALPRAHR